MKRVIFKVAKAIKEEEASNSCYEGCPHYKNGECTYYGTDWRECPKS